MIRCRPAVITIGAAAKFIQTPMLAVGQAEYLVDK
jgi:hypothetical protein